MERGVQSRDVLASQLSPQRSQMTASVCWPVTTPNRERSYAMSTATVSTPRTAALYEHNGQTHVAILNNGSSTSRPFSKQAKADKYVAHLEREGYTVARGPSAYELAAQHNLVPSALAGVPPTPDEQTAAADANAKGETERAAQRQKPGDVVVEPVEEKAKREAAETAGIVADRKKALAQAEKCMLQGFRKLVTGYRKRDEAQRTWFVDRGEEFYATVRPAVYAGVKWVDAMSKLTTMLMAELGSGMTEDLARSMQAYCAALHFGRADYCELPTRAQKSLASLFDKAKEVGQDGAETGVLVYRLAKLSTDDAARLWTWVMGENKDTLPVPNATYTTHGTLAGEDADLLVQALKTAAKAAAEAANKPVADTAVTKPGTDGKVAAADAVAAEVAGKKGGKGKGPNAGAKTKPGLAIVGEKPAVAAAALVATVADYPKGDVFEMLTQAGKAPELGEEMIDALLVGIADRGDLALLLHIAAVVEREAMLLDQRIKVGGKKNWATVSRQDAEKALKAGGQKLPKVG